MEIGQRIKLFRQNVGMSREELAKKVTLSKFAISKYEQGQRMPSIDVLNKIATALGVSIDDLLNCKPLLSNSTSYIDNDSKMIRLKNIDLSKATIKEQYNKAFEEQHELEVELVKLEENIFLQSLTSVFINNSKERQKVIEEFWDMVQAWLGVLAIDGISADEVMAEYPKHLEKLKDRPRRKKE